MRSQIIEAIKKHAEGHIAKHKANIAGMSLSRNQVGECALTVINLDADLDPSARETLLADTHIHSAKLLYL